jgi:hypothetical protein
VSGFRAATDSANASALAKSRRIGAPADVRIAAAFSIDPEPVHGEARSRRPVAASVRVTSMRPSLSLAADRGDRYGFDCATGDRAMCGWQVGTT